MPDGDEEVGLHALVEGARAALPGAHRALLQQLRIQETVIDAWPEGVLDLYRTLGETPPDAVRLSDAAAVYLDARRTIAFNGPFLRRAMLGLGRSSAEFVVHNLTWHEYGHALSLVRATAEQRQDGPRLFDLLPEGLRAGIDYPGGYRPSEVFDEVVATVYALMVGRVRTQGYGDPEFLHADVLRAFKEVIPWPPIR